jgi:hypothetical protein
MGGHLRSPSGAVTNPCLEGRGHHDGGTNMLTGPAGPKSVHNQKHRREPYYYSKVLGRGVTSRIENHKRQDLHGVEARRGNGRAAAAR